MASPAAFGTPLKKMLYLSKIRRRQFRTWDLETNWQKSENEKPGFLFMKFHCSLFFDIPCYFSWKMPVIFLKDPSLWKAHLARRRSCPCHSFNYSTTCKAVFGCGDGAARLPRRRGGGRAAAARPAWPFRDKGRTGHKEGCSIESVNRSGANASTQLAPTPTASRSVGRSIASVSHQPDANKMGRGQDAVLTKIFLTPFSPSEDLRSKLPLSFLIPSRMITVPVL